MLFEMMFRQIYFQLYRGCYKEGNAVLSVWQ